MMDTTQSKTTHRGAADTSLAPGGAPHTCCGGPAPSGTSGCCALDAEVKSTRGHGMRVRVGRGNTGGQEVSLLRVTPSLVEGVSGLRSLTAFASGGSRVCPLVKVIETSPVADIVQCGLNGRKALRLRRLTDRLHIALVSW